MNMITRFAAVGFVAAAALATAPAQATLIPDGTVSVSGNFNPTVNLVANPKTFSATFGTTFEITGTGGFAGATGGSGKLNGVLDFSSTVGTTLNQSLANFFTFADGTGHNFQFSVKSVTTDAYTSSPASTSIGLYLLGNTVDTFLGYGATPTSLTLTFNKTRSSAYSTSATLATVPEPATWAMALMGFGAMGVAMRRRPRTSISFA